MNEICAEINSEIFDGAEIITKDVRSFSELELLRCKENFRHCGYTVSLNSGILNAMK